MTPKEIYALAEKHGLLYVDEDSRFNNNPADRRHRSRLINFANAVLKSTTELKDQDEDFTGPEKA